MGTPGTFPDTQADHTVALATPSRPFTVEATTTTGDAFTSLATLSGFVQTDSAKSPQFEDGVYVVPRGEGSLLQLQFYGEGSDNQTFSFRIEEWNTYKQKGTVSQATGVIQWEPTGQYTSGVATLCASTGVAGGVVTNSHRWVDTITGITRGIPGSGAAIAGPSVADDGKISLFIDGTAAQLMIVRLTLSGGTASSAGFCWRWVTTQ